MKISEAKILHLPILVEQDEDNFYIVSCPVFKGCHSYGTTIDEALANIKEVIDMCIEEERGKASDYGARITNPRCGLQKQDWRMIPKNNCYESC